MSCAGTTLTRPDKKRAAPTPPANAASTARKLVGAGLNPAPVTRLGGAAREFPYAGGDRLHCLHHALGKVAQLGLHLADGRFDAVGHLAPDDAHASHGAPHLRLGAIASGT